MSRIRFIKHAQELGFSLTEIGELLKLEDGVDRRAIRRISSERLLQIEAKLTDLKRIPAGTQSSGNQCEVAGTDHPCPIIEALTGASAKNGV